MEQSKHSHSKREDRGHGKGKWDQSKIKSHPGRHKTLQLCHDGFIWAPKVLDILASMVLPTTANMHSLGLAPLHAYSFPNWISNCRGISTIQGLFLPVGPHLHRFKQTMASHGFLTENLTHFTLLGLSRLREPLYKPPCLLALAIYHVSKKMPCVQCCQVLLIA